MIEATRKTLESLGIDARSVTTAIQGVRSLTQIVPETVIYALTGLERFNTFDNVYADAKTALHVAQHLVEVALTNDTFDAEQAIVDGENRSKRVREAMPWVDATEAEQIASTTVKKVEGVETTVKLNAQGKIKKGGKQILANELYTKHVLNATEPMTNKDFIALLMKELEMSKPGATTYAYNARNTLGVVEGQEIKRKQRRQK